MSAREELFRRVAGSFVDEDRANALIDAYAHELAEEIRREVQTFKNDGILEPDKDWTASGAADLIDPEVS